MNYSNQLPLPIFESNYYFLHFLKTIDRNSLSQVEEDEFLEAVRASIRVEGRERVLDAIFAEGEFVNDALNDEETEDSDEHRDDSDDSSSLEDSVDEESVEENHDEVDKVKLHNPIIHDNVHCPPFDDMSSTFCGFPYGICDCEDFCFALYFQENNFQFFKDCFYSIDFDAQFMLAFDGIDNVHRRPNNEMRKYYYKKIFFSIDFGVVEKGERRRLPNCAVAKVRQIFPSDSGYYMGFKDF